MPDDPSLHDVLRGSLAHHAERLGDPPADITAVWSQVDRRRSRRRSFAVAGSLAVVAAGATGIMLLPDDASAPAPGALPTSSPEVTALPPYNVWRCSGDLGVSDGDAEGRYFESCNPITIPPELNVDPTTTLVLATTPWPSDPKGTVVPVATTAPFTVSAVEQVYLVQPGDSIFSIADLHGISMEALVNYNDWDDGIDHPLVVDEEVKIPPGSAITP